MTKKSILIATGGTGGHIYPAYSLANYFIRKNYRIKLTTDIRGYNYLKMYKNLDLKKIPFSPLIKKNIFKYLYSIFVVVYSIGISFLFLLFNRPSVIFGMGGYSSFPICIAASFLKIKFVIYESNLVIGKANRFLLPFAKKVFVSYKELEGIPKNYNHKVVEIGNIVREEIINSGISSKEINTFDKIKILVLGGSQAAKIFANKLPQIFYQLKKSKFIIKVYQQCHIDQNNQLSSFYKDANIEHEIFNFTDKIIDYYKKANLVITRSGASVLGELINIKIPFISIPLPTSADNHQFKNAEFYSKRGCGLLVKEEYIENELLNKISSLFKDKSQISNILSKQRQYSDKDIFRNLNTQIEKIVNEKN